MALRSSLQAFVKGSDQIYRCPAFAELSWLDHGFETRHAAPNPNVITLRQVHSAVVWDARGLKDRQEEGDALISDESSTVVGVRTADCVPILLADTKMHAVAAIHAGWRGTAAKIVLRTIEKMTHDFETAPENVRAAIGPSIGACCYRVGIDVARQFSDLFPELGNLLGPDVRIDLAEANRRVLLQAGLAHERIYAAGLCTKDGESDFYSYRREPNDPGRMISFISRLT